MPGSGAVGSGAVVSGAAGSSDVADVVDCAAAGFADVADFVGVDDVVKVLIALAIGPVVRASASRKPVISNRVESKSNPAAAT